MISSTSSTPTVNTLGSTASTASTPVDQNLASQDRFLKLLVAQLNNQDPMNPMDNAQMTSQMAQINTVTGIQQVNDTLKNMATQFNSMQVLQGSSLVGREVMIESNSMSNKAGVATGTLDLAGNADMVKVDVLSPAGQLLDTLNLGAKTAGQFSFNWDSSKYPAGSNPMFKVTATQAGTAIASTSLARDKVMSVGSANGAMTVQLQSQGALAYSSIKAIL
jgi:flagellar basal-body rod modification protein FlgD